MNTLGKLFLKGLVVVLPLLLTAALVTWMAIGAERWLGDILKALLPEGRYVPGMGLIAALASITLIGLLSHAWLFRRLFEFGENALNRIPLISSIYSAFKDFFAYFSQDEHSERGKVALVNIPGQPVSLIGFITRDDLSELQLPIETEDTIAVYLPMSYQIGGYTLYLPRKYVTPLDMSFEDAMRLTLTGGLASQRQNH